MYEPSSIYGNAKLAGQVGPFEAEVFWDPRRDVVTVKFRKQVGDTGKKGVKIRLCAENIESTMEEIPPGGDYPEVRFTLEW